MSLEFTAPIALTLNNPSTAFPSLLLTSDLNGDGNLDLVTDFSMPESNPSSPINFSLEDRKKGVAVLYGTGGGRFAVVQEYAIETVIPNPQYEAYQQRYQAALQSYQNFVKSLPTGVTAQPFSYSETPPPATKVSSIPVNSISIGDIDRDGKLDIVTLGTSSSTGQSRFIISVLKGTGSGFAAPILSPTTTLSDRLGNLAVGDFNRDGNLDTAVIRSFANDSDPAKQQVTVLLGDGTGLFGNERAIDSGIATSSLVTGDFNGDGWADLAVSGRGGGYSYGVNAKVSILLSDGAGGFSPPKILSPQASSSGRELFAADFNNDGRIDLGTSDGYLAGDGTGQFVTLKPFELSGGAIATGDFNGDGNLDIASYVLNYGTSSISILLGNGAGKYSYPTVAANLSGASAIAVGDFDRDGKLDIAASQSKTISVLLNRTTTSSLLVVGDGVIDASIATGGLTVDLQKGTLKIGGVNQHLNGQYRNVRGTEQADRITGGKKREFLAGLGGDDVLVGGANSDSLIGGFGNDSLTGGKGSDRFVFSQGDTFVADQSVPFTRSMGVDKLTDFQSGQDKIELYRNTFTAFKGRGISLESVATKKVAQRSKAVLTYITKTGSLFYNQNGRKAGFGSGGQFADLADGLKIQGKDFQLS